jgi:CIC family chloride channel protein
LPEVSNRTFLPVVIATGAATLIGRVLIGPNPAFAVPELVFPPARCFGFEEALCGLAAWAFIRLLVFMEDGFPRLSGNIYLQNIIGMTLIGLMMVGLTRAFGHSYVDGSRLWRHPVGPRPRDDGDRAPGPAVACLDNAPRCRARYIGGSP